MRRLNFSDKSKKNIRRLKRFYRRNAPSSYKSEKVQYEQILGDLRDLANELNKVSKGYGDIVLKKANQRKSVLTNPKSLIAKQIKREQAKLPKNRKKTAQYLKSVRRNLAEITRQAQNNPANVKNYITTIAAKVAGIKTKRASRSGQIKPDFTGATEKQKKAYSKARKFIKSGKTDLILRAMGAYEKSYGNKGKVANSSEVMENIATYVQEHPNATIDDIIADVHAAID